MPGNNRDAAFLAGRKRRPLFRRLFYREAPFFVLDAAELAAIFEAFSCVVRLHPVILYWVHRLNDQEHLVSSFYHRSMVDYSGLEVAHVTPDHLGYYRLPGAKVGGRGRIEPGMYSVSIQSPGRERHYLRIRKCEFGQLRLDEVFAPPVQGAESILPLKWHALNRSKFADEMKTIVERALEWDYQRALLREPDLLRETDWSEIDEKCRGMSGKSDALLRALAKLRRAEP